MTILSQVINLSGAFILMVVPLATHAWLFNSASAQKALSDFSFESTQTITLLASALSMNSKLTTNEEVEIVITDGEALSADMGPLGTSADIVYIPPNETISSYIVQPGDSVGLVAKKFNVSENTIRWANNLKKNDVLRRGQTLVILPITGVKHVVAKGDTIEGIARKYKGDALDIALYNNIDIDAILSIGTTIIIPDGEITIVNTVTKQVVSGGGVTKGITATGGYYIRPIETNGGNIRKTQGFHDRYNAIDIGAPTGTPIKAMASGTVIAVKSPQAWNGGYGGLTIIQHGNGTQTLYAHQSRISVSVGQKVSQGQTIGNVGSTGRSTGPHLHYEVRGVGKTPILY